MDYRDRIDKREERMRITYAFIDALLGDDRFAVCGDRIGLGIRGPVDMQRRGSLGHVAYVYAIAGRYVPRGQMHAPFRGPWRPTAVMAAVAAAKQFSKYDMRERHAVPAHLLAHIPAES
jgi:hypothetical protein